MAEVASCAVLSRMAKSAPSTCRRATGQVFFASDIAFTKPIVAVSARPRVQAVELSGADLRQGALRRRSAGDLHRADARGSRRHRAILRHRFRGTAGDMGHRRRAEADAPRVHDSWSDNVYIETRIADRRSRRRARRAPSDGPQEPADGRHAGVSMEGRGVLAHYDRRLDELVVYSSTQFPHVIRTILATVWESPKASCG